nr:MAG TPA: hypothetical protein [Bacteriophage sp.]DAW45142.1 MAG TPA: hypothetical protein [Bacteriophage sp.]
MYDLVKLLNQKSILFIQLDLKKRILESLPIL